MAGDRGRGDLAVIHLGGRTATAQGRLVTEVGEILCAHAKTTCLILR